MDDPPRSSKRRKLDTPTRKASSPLVKSALKNSAGRSASQSTSLANGSVGNTDDESGPPRRKLSKRNGTPHGTVNGTQRKHNKAQEEEDIYDDIEGALEGESLAPSPAPSLGTGEQRRRKRVSDALRPQPSEGALGNATSTRGTPRTPGNTNGENAGRKPFRALANGCRHKADLEAEIQDELAVEMASPTIQAEATCSASKAIISPARGENALCVKLRSRTSGRVSGKVDEESLGQPQGNRVDSMPSSKAQSEKKRSAIGRTRARKDANEESHTATPSRSSKRRAPNPNPEDELGDCEPPSRASAAKDRRRAHHVDHYRNRDETVVHSEDEEADGAVEASLDFDGISAMGGVLDPSEPSPFNKPGSARKKDVVVSLQGSLPSGRELGLLKSIVMERITAKRPVSLIGLDGEYKSVYQLIEHTITAGEGNSMLLIGARGSGKTALVNKVLAEVAKGNSEDYHVVRLNGFIHTDDKIALREIWRQLGKDMEIEEDEGLGKNYADTLATLLALLSHPSEQTSELTDQVAKAVIFIMDEFDLLASHPRQTLLYNLFDIAQSRKAPIAVLGLTTRIDVANSLEKRVKSRFSHRYVHLSLAKSFTAFQEMCKASLLVQPDQLSVEERAILYSLPTTTPGKDKETKKATTRDILSEWNANVLSLFTSKSFLTEQLAPHFYLTKSIPAVLTSFLYPTAALSSDTPSMAFTSLLSPPDSKLCLIPQLPTLALSLLIASARLDIIHDSDTCNFNMAYDEYVNLASKARIQSAAGGASASGSVTKVWGKEAAKRQWEVLVELGLVMPIVSGQTGGFGMVKCDVALEEIGAVITREKGIERMLESGVARFEVSLF